MNTSIEDLIEGVEGLRTHRADYDLAWAMWAGETEEEFASAAMAKRFASIAGLYRINLAKVPILVAKRRLRLHHLVVLDDETGKADSDLTSLLATTLAANSMQLQWGRSIRNTLIYGDTYLSLWKGTDDPHPTITYRDPLTCRALYDSNEHKTCVVERWQTATGVIRASITYPDRKELGWYLKADSDETNPQSWVREKEGATVDGVITGDVVNPWGVIPIVHWRTDLPYGTPDHLDAFGAQTAIQKVASGMASGTDAMGAPARYALLDPEAAMRGEGFDNPDWDDDTDVADEYDAEDFATRTGAGPGEMDVLTGLKSVGEWSSGKATEFVGAGDWFRHIMAVTTSTPDRYLTGQGNTPSGAALRVADAPLKDRVEDLRVYFDAAVRETGDLLLRLHELEGWRVEPKWQPTGIVDDDLTWQIVQAKINAGVPPVKALTETGLYGTDEVEAWFKDSNVQMDVTRRVTILGSVASSISQLNEGVATGLISQTDAENIISTTIGQLTLLDPTPVEGS